MIVLSWYFVVVPCLLRSRYIANIPIARIPLAAPTAMPTLAPVARLLLAGGGVVWDETSFVGLVYEVRDRAGGLDSDGEEGLEPLVEKVLEVVEDKLGGLGFEAEEGFGRGGLRMMEMIPL